MSIWQVYITFLSSLSVHNLWNSEIRCTTIPRMKFNWMLPVEEEKRNTLQEYLPQSWHRIRHFPHMIKSHLHLTTLRSRYYYLNFQLKTLLYLSNVLYRHYYIRPKKVGIVLYLPLYPAVSTGSGTWLNSKKYLFNEWASDILSSLYKVTVICRAGIIPHHAAQGTVTFYCLSQTTLQCFDKYSKPKFILNVSRRNKSWVFILFFLYIM